MLNCFGYRVAEAIKSELFTIDTHLNFSLEAVSKPHLRLNGSVAALFKMLTYRYMLRFFIGLRLARNLI